MSTAFPSALDTSTTLYDLVNNAQAALAAGYTAGGTTLDLDSAALFPATGGIIYVGNERTTYTGKTSNQLTGVTALSNNYPSSTAVVMYLDAEHVEVLRDAIIAVETRVGVTGSTVAGTLTKRIADLEGAGGETITISAKTGAYTVVAGDLGAVIDCTSGTFTVSLTAAATLGVGFNCWIKNYGSGAITIDPNASEDIDDYASIILRSGESVQIFCTGTAWRTNDGQYSQAIATSRQPGAGRPVASATNSTAMGANSGGNASQAVTGAGSMALGGSYASGTDSFASGIGNNTSSYGALNNNDVAIGLLAKASGSPSIALGSTSIVTGSRAIGICCDGASVTGSYSTALGGYQPTDNGLVGKMVFGSRVAFALSQTGLMQLGKATTDATASVLTSNTSGAGTTNQLILPNNTAYAFDGLVVSRQQAADGTASAAWKVEGLIRREANAGTTTLVASTVTAISNVPGWTLALSADTTNGGLTITFTGAAATDIRTFASIRTAEVTYA